jgi:hypothetical protein
MKLRFAAVLFALFIFGDVFGDEKSTDIREVISEGVGVDPQSAAQNAAENALKNVVGSFMDTKTLLEKRTVIDNGIQSQSKNISKDIKEYSQGSIKSFEIIDTKNEAGLFRLTAKIAVRNENFSTYIKKIAQGEIKVDGGLFAGMATEIKQKDNLVGILKDNVILPILSGEVQNFTVGEPMLLFQAIKDNQLPQWVSSNITQNARNNPHLVIFKVKTELKKSFLDNLNKTLISTASSQKECLRNQESDWCITKIVNLQPKTAEHFTYAGLKAELGKKFNCTIYRGSCSIPSLIPSLKVSIRDKQNEVLMSGKIDANGNSKNVEIIRFKFRDGASPYIVDNIPWALFKDRLSNLENDSLPELIIQENSFYILLDVESEIMKNADKILVSLGEFNNENFEKLNEEKLTSMNKNIENNQSNFEKKQNEPQINITNDLKIKEVKSDKKNQQFEVIKTKSVMNIEQKINSNWKDLIKNANFSLLNPELVSKFKCVVLATISQDGKVLDTAMQDNSSYAGFDSLAENAVKKSAPLSVPKDEELFEKSFKIMTFVFDRNSVEVKTSE